MATMTVLDSAGGTQTVLKPVGGQATMAGSIPVAFATDQPLSLGLNFTTPPIVPTIQAAAYAIGNCIGGLQTIAFFRVASNFSALLKGLSLIWLGAQTTPLNFYIFSKNPTSSTFTDKGAFTIANADAKWLVFDPISITPFQFPGASQSGATYQMSISAYNTDIVRGQNLYVAIEVAAAVTPAVGDLVFDLQGILD